MDDEKKEEVVIAVRTKLPDTRKSLTHKFTIFGGDVQYDEVKIGDRILYDKKVCDLKGYVTVGMYEDGNPGEFFLTIGKAGGIWKIYDALMIAISIGLQYGIPLHVFADKFQYMNFSPQGITKNPDIPIAKSIVDYLAHWFIQKFKKDE